jgi:hypothetical protein
MRPVVSRMIKWIGMARPLFLYFMPFKKNLP